MRRWQTKALILIAATFTLATAWGIWGGLPFAPFSNESEQVFFALKFASGDLNPRLFVHPPLLAYLLCGLYGLTFIAGWISQSITSVADFEKLFFTNPTVFYLVARVFTLLLGIASLFVFYRVARKLYGRVDVALLATALLATSATHVTIAHFGAPDILMMFLTLLAFVPITHILRGSENLRYYAASGFLVGLAVAAKYNAFFAGVALAIAHGLGSTRRGSGFRGALFNRNLWLAFFFIGLGFVVGCPYALLDFKTFYAGYQKLKANASSSEYLFAHLRPQNPGASQLLFTFFPTILGLPLAIFSYIALLHAIWRHRRQDVLLVAFILGYSSFIAPHNLIKPYYFVHILPFVFLLAAKSCISLVDNLPLGRFRLTLIVSLFLALSASSLGKIVRFDRLISETPAMVLAKQWAESNIAPGTGVAVFEGMPLNPNVTSIDRQILETEVRGFGAGVRLRRLRKYAESTTSVYDVYEFPNPWRSDFLPSKFDYSALRKAGVQFVIINDDWERYLSDRVRFPAQAELHDRLLSGCRRSARFEQSYADVDLGAIGASPEGYVEIYDCSAA